MSLRISIVVRSHSFAKFFSMEIPLRMDCIQGNIGKLEMDVIPSWLHRLPLLLYNDLKITNGINRGSSVSLSVTVLRDSNLIPLRMPAAFRITKSGVFRIIMRCVSYYNEVCFVL